MYVDLNSRFTLHNEKKNLEKIISKRSYDFFIEKGESTKKKNEKKICFLILTFILRFSNPLP